MALETYREKRHFDRTPEPQGEPGSTASGRSFVVQKHAARRLHYDFRLEWGGVLKSWAVPKGPSLDPGDKRLAVETEDHPIEYGGFEGVIPEGEYGGGTVLLWDHGTWTPDGDPEKGYRRGKLSFELRGEKLSGRYALVKIRGRKDERKDNWLLIKEDDEVARPGRGTLLVDERPESVATGRSMEEIAEERDRVWSSNGGETTSAGPAEVEGARKAKMPTSIEPQLATLVEEPPKGPEEDGWLHEIKLDGYRLLAFVEGGSARLMTRKEQDWTAKFQPVADALSVLPVERAVFDGEVVALEPDGTTSFSGLQKALSEGRPQSLHYFLFDLLYLDGYDLRKVPLVERKRLLERLLPDGSGVLRYSDHVEGRGEDFYRQACRYRLEGVVSKRAAAPYRPGRGRDWQKSKCLARQEVVIGGFTEPSGSRTGLGALTLGYHRDGRLVYAGRCGTGFSTATLQDLRRRLDRLARKTTPFDQPPTGADARGVQWVSPRLVCEVEFTEWTADGRMRHPVFLGLREDKDPQEIVREQPAPAAEPAAEAKKGGRMADDDTPAKSTAQKSTAKKGTAEVAGVRITSADRVVYDGMALTKLDHARYYERIGDWMLPHVADRPLSLVRCPKGRTDECFYQKHVGEQFPDAVHRVAVEEKEDEEPREYAMVDSVAGLVALVQMGVLEIHVWGSRTDRLERPDRVVFDLDPDVGLAWERVLEATLAVRRRLADLGLESFVKTTGGKGLHVVMPLTRRHDWDEVKAFAKAVAADMVKREPGKYTDNVRKERRKGRVFIDYLRNGRGATYIAPFSTRARPGAPVSVPVAWDALGPDLSSDRWNVETLPARLERLKRDPWAEMDGVRQSITRDVRAELGLGR